MYGYPIPQVAENVQKEVRAAVEMMTGLHVAAVNVHIVSVTMAKPAVEENTDEIEAE